MVAIRREFALWIEHLKLGNRTALVYVGRSHPLRERAAQQRLNVNQGAVRKLRVTGERV